jgi:hypothetical protein
MHDDDPLIHLLSIRKNPMLLQMTPEQLMGLAIKFRTPSTPPKSKSTTAKKLTLEQRKQAIRDAM